MEVASSSLATDAVDFAGPFLGEMFLVVVDAHSKWTEVVQMNSTTATKAVEEMRRLFTTHGLLEQLVSDKGPQFVAEETKESNTYGQRHTTQLQMVWPSGSYKRSNKLCESSTWKETPLLETGELHNSL